MQRYLNVQLLIFSPLRVSNQSSVVLEAPTVTTRYIVLRFDHAGTHFNLYSLGDKSLFTPAEVPPSIKREFAAVPWEMWVTPNPAWGHDESLEPAADSAAPGTLWS